MTDLFQSPSLRGSGRFKLAGKVLDVDFPASLNPLHCGAVVASQAASWLALGVRTES